MREKLPDLGGWEWCTSEGARLATLLLGLETTLREKVEWLEEAETLSLRFSINHAKAVAEGRISPDAETASESKKP